MDNETGYRLLGNGIGLGTMLGFVKFFYSRLDKKFEQQEVDLKEQKKAIDKDIAKLQDSLKEKVDEKDFIEKISEIKTNIEKFDENNRDEHQALFKSSTEQLRILSFLEGRFSNNLKKGE